MKKQLLAFTLLSSLLLGALIGCDSADSAITGRPDIEHTTATTKIAASSAIKTTTPPASTAVTTEPPVTILDPTVLVPSDEPFAGLNVIESGTIYYDSSLEKCGVPYLAVFVPASGGNMQYFVYDGAHDNHKMTWRKLPERSYRGDLLWATYISDGKYVNCERGLSEGLIDIWSTTYYNSDKIYDEFNFPGAFFSVGGVEIRTVFHVEFRMEYYDPDFSFDSPERVETLFEEQEAFFESLGFEIIRDHRYARQRESVDILDAELLVAGTLRQAESLHENQSSDPPIYYELAVASYVHYAPEEFVDVDPALIAPK